MLAYIKGNLVTKTTGYIVVETAGIGYKIYMPESAIEKLQEVGSTVTIHTFMRVREDDISLYGFITNEELRMFELLLSVSGIGAKGALNILSNVTPSRFAIAVITNDMNVLKKIPGIGPKTGQRIILELKDKLKKEEELAKEEQNSQEYVQNENLDDNKITEVVSALQVLGYSRKEIADALVNVKMADLSVEDIIRKALSNLSKI